VSGRDWPGGRLPEARLYAVKGNPGEGYKQAW